MLSFERFSEQLKSLSIKARRMGYANNCLSAGEAEEAREVFTSAAREFAAKYAMDSKSAEDMAIHAAETLDLGLAY